MTFGRSVQRVLMLVALVLLMMGVPAKPAAAQVDLAARDDITAPGSTVHRVWFPFVSVAPPTDWPYPPVGMALANGVGGDSVLTSQLSGYWYYDWSQRCDSADTRDRRHVPMIWGASLLTEFITGTVQQPIPTVKSTCNDGRPLFVLNEPEMCFWGSACVTPAQSVDLLDQVVASGWRGPIYMAGVQVSSYAENWIQQMLDAYQRKHGTRVVRGIAGWHVHMYADIWAGHFDGRYSISATDATPLTRMAVMGPGYSLRTFIENRRAEGNPTSVVVSESGWLANTIDHLGGVPEPQVAAALLDGFAQEFASTPEVKAWAWYSNFVPHHTTDPAKDPTGYCGMCFDAGNLLEITPDGQPPIPTVAGEHWHSWALQLNNAAPAVFH